LPGIVVCTTTAQIFVASIFVDHGRYVSKAASASRCSATEIDPAAEGPAKAGHDVRAVEA